MKSFILKKSLFVILSSILMINCVQPSHKADLNFTLPDSSLKVLTEALYRTIGSEKHAKPETFFDALAEEGSKLDAALTWFGFALDSEKAMETLMNCRNEPELTVVYRDFINWATYRVMQRFNELFTLGVGGIEPRKEKPFDNICKSLKENIGDLHAEACKMCELSGDSPAKFEGKTDLFQAIEECCKLLNEVCCEDATASCFANIGKTTKLIDTVMVKAYTPLRRLYQSVAILMRNTYQIKLNIVTEEHFELVGAKQDVSQFKLKNSMRVNFNEYMSIQLINALIDWMGHVFPYKCKYDKSPISDGLTKELNAKFGDLEGFIGGMIGYSSLKDLYKLQTDYLLMVYYLVCLDVGLELSKKTKDFILRFEKTIAEYDVERKEEAKRNKAQKDLDEANAKTQQAMTEKAAKEAEAARLQQEKDAALKAAKEAEERRAQQEQERREQQQKEQAERETRRKARAFKEAQDKAARQEQERQFQDQINQQNNQIKELKSGYNTAQSNLTKAQEELDRIQANLTAAEVRTEAQKRELDAAKENVASLTRSRDEAQKQLALTQDELRDTQKQVATLSAENEIMGAKVATHSKDIEELRAAIFTPRQRTSDEEQEYRDLKEKHELTLKNAPSLQRSSSSQVASRAITQSVSGASGISSASNSAPVEPELEEDYELIDNTDPASFQ